MLSKCQFLQRMACVRDFAVIWRQLDEMSPLKMRQYRLQKGRFLLLARLYSSGICVLVWSAAEAVMPCWKRDVDDRIVYYILHSY